MAATVGQGGGRTVGPRQALLGLAGLLALAPLAAQDSSAVRIQISGINAELTRNVLAVMQLAREASDGKLTHARIVHLHRRAETEIETALRPYGFYEPRIAKALLPGAAEWLAEYSIDPGPAVKVKSVTIEVLGPGKDSPGVQHAVAGFPLHQGDTLRDPLYEAGKLAILTAASDSGYLDADFDTTAIVVNREAHSAAILIRFETGERFKFGPVRFEQTMLDESLLRKRVPFKTGQWYGQHKLLELQTALTEDPYFARVEVLPQRNEAKDREVPIRVLLEPRKLWTTEFGLGYGTDTGPRGRSNFIWRRINAQGHYAEAALIVSPTEQSTSLRYNIPGIGHPNGVLTFFGGFSRLSVGTHFLQPADRQHFIGRTYAGGARLFRHRRGWLETLSLSYQHSSFEIGLDSGRVDLLVPGLSWQRTRADDRRFPRRGLRTEVDLQGSEKALFSSASFLQVRGSAKLVYGFAPGFRVLARAELGRTFTHDFHQLPPTLRFFTGGDASVRGYGYYALSPRDANGDIIGGQALMDGSVEVDYRVMGHWAIALFSDAGNAMERFTLSGLGYSVGGGVRFVSPIGMVRLDGAFPLSRNHGPFRIHISMGPDL
jgi:translocation and assembly module TamA